MMRSQVATQDANTPKKEPRRALRGGSIRTSWPDFAPSQFQYSPRIRSLGESSTGRTAPECCHPVPPLLRAASLAARSQWDRRASSMGVPPLLRAARLAARSQWDRRASSMGVYKRLGIRRRKSASVCGHALETQGADPDAVAAFPTRPCCSVSKPLIMFGGRKVSRRRKNLWPILARSGFHFWVSELNYYR